MAQTYKKISREDLMTILKDHRRWLSSDGKEGKRGDLTGVDLSGLDSNNPSEGYIPPIFWEKNLSKIILRNSNLNGLSFREINLYGADFRGANLKDAKFYQACLSYADCSKADFSEADINETSLVHANLSETTLSKTNIGYSYLNDANLQKAVCRETRFRRTELQGADLHDADFYGASFTGSIIEEQQLRHFKFAAEIEFDIMKDTPSSDISSLPGKILLSENKIRQLEEKLTQAESKNQGNQAEIDRLKKQIDKTTKEKEQTEEELNKLKDGLKSRIQDAGNSLANALKNTDKQIEQNEKSACWFKWFGITLFGITIILLLAFSRSVFCLPELLSAKNLNILSTPSPSLPSC